MLRWHGVPDRLAEKIATGALETALERTMRFGALDLSSESPQPLLLAGPPGAGKTLTVARLATRLVMAGAQPLIITTDGRRAGATEQLAAFTRLLGLTLIVASHPATLARALLRRVPGAPVLIDAPGTDPFDPSQNDEVAGLAATADATTALVLPAGHGSGRVGRPGRRLRRRRGDPARRNQAGSGAAGGGAAGRRGCRPKLTMTEAGIGPGAADGLEPLTPVLLADRLSAKQRVPSQSVVRGVAGMTAHRSLVLDAEAAASTGHRIRQGRRREDLACRDPVPRAGAGGPQRAAVRRRSRPRQRRHPARPAAGARSVRRHRRAPQRGRQRRRIYAPGGFGVLAGRSGSGALSGVDPAAARPRAARAGGGAVGQDIVLDLGAGLDRSVRRMAAVADTLLVVATEEPTSLTDAYAVLKLAAADRPGGDVRLVINQASSAAAAERTYATLARASATFLGHKPPLAGHHPAGRQGARRHPAPGAAPGAPPEHAGRAGRGAAGGRAARVELSRSVTGQCLRAAGRGRL